MPAIRRCPIHINRIRRDRGLPPRRAASGEPASVTAPASICAPLWPDSSTTAENDGAEAAGATVMESIVPRYFARDRLANVRNFGPALEPVNRLRRFSGFIRRNVALGV